jgi:hypothetical protein
LAALWFMAGVCFTLTSIILLLPWLRTIPGLGSLPALPWQAGIAAAVTAAAVVGLCMWLEPVSPAAAAPVSGVTAGTGKTVAADGAGDSWAGIANVLGRDAGAMTNTTPSSGARAGSMNAAIASLQARLAKGGGGAADWELLAKSYEFLGRPGEASQARAHQLPALPADLTSTSPAPATAAPADKVAK